jgi:hypothetical protein
MSIFQFDRRELPPKALGPLSEVVSEQPAVHASYRPVDSMSGVEFFIVYVPGLLGAPSLGCLDPFRF